MVLVFIHMDAVGCKSRMKLSSISCVQGLHIYQNRHQFQYAVIYYEWDAHDTDDQYVSVRVYACSLLWHRTRMCSSGNQLIWVDHRYYWYTCVFHFLGVPAGIQAAYAIVPQHVCWGISSNGILHLKVHVSLHFLHLSFCCVVIVLLQPTSPLIFWAFLKALPSV